MKHCNIVDFESDTLQEPLQVPGGGGGEGGDLLKCSALKDTQQELSWYLLGYNE